MIGRFTVLAIELGGGLALFIFGMRLLSDGLRHAAGNRLRWLLSAMNRRPVAALPLGIVLGALVHSSAGMVMLVGFVHAGLLSLAQSILPMIGINIGTTLSMQLVALRLDDYALAAIAVGAAVRLAAGGERWRRVGDALLAFGLLFLGMRIMRQALTPHRDLLLPIMARIDGGTVRGMLGGIAAATAVTAVIQSSGATIGMGFALIASGAITHFAQIYPLVLGAHLGTCATALLGSIGAHPDARRTALGHLLFNGVNVFLAVILSPWLLRWIPLLSSDLTRQAAHLHTLAMVMGALVVVPLRTPFLSVLNGRMRTRRTVPPPSRLDPALLDRPEAALQAVTGELQRVLDIASQSLRSLAVLFFESRRATSRAIERNESAINAIKAAVRGYLDALSRNDLSRRQILLSLHLYRGVAEVERIGDHIHEIQQILTARKRMSAKAALDPIARRNLLHALRETSRIIGIATATLEATDDPIQEKGVRLQAVCTAYLPVARAIRTEHEQRLANHAVQPAAALVFSEVLSALNRIVRHAQDLAVLCMDPDFRIKPEKLDRNGSNNRIRGPGVQGSDKCIRGRVATKCNRECPSTCGET